MKDKYKTKEKLIDELDIMRQRISELEAVELELRNNKFDALENQSKYQALVETSSDFIWEIDINGVYTYCGPQMEKLWGLKPEEMLGKTPFDLLPPEDREQAIKVFSSLLESISPFTNMEMRSFDGTGRIVFLEISGVPFFDTAGKHCGYRGITRDITERKKVEEKLQESEEKYRLLFDSSDNPTTVYDSNGVLILMNKVAAASLGGVSTDFIGKPISEVHPDVAQTAMERIRTVIETRESREFDTVIDLPSGKRWFWSNFQPIKDAYGNVNVVQIISYDITERKQAEETIKNSEALKRSIMDAMPDNVALVDDTGIILDVNESMAKSFSKRKEELTGMYGWDLLPSDLMKSRKGHFEEVFKTGKIVRFEDENRGVCFDNIIYPVFQERGKVIQVAVIARDITEHKRVEHDLRERIKELTCLYGVGQLTSSLGTTSDEIMGGTVDLLPPDWQYPEITCARITLDGKEYRTGNFLVTKWKQSSNIVADNKKIGIVEVYYLEEKPKIHEGPFLREERELLDTIASMLGKRFERQQAMAMLRESEERLRLLLESTEDIVVMQDLEGKYLYYNGPAMYGLSIKEVLGKKPHDFFEPSEAALMDKLREKAIQSGRSISGESNTTWNGAELVFLNQVSPVRDIEGNISGTVLVARNITEQVGIRKRINFLAKIVETTPISIIATDENKKITYINRATEEMFGYTQEELIGKDPGMLDAEPNADEIEKNIVQTIMRNEAWTAELLNKKKNGELFNILATVYQLLDDQGKHLSLVGFQQDITERTKVEGQLRFLSLITEQISDAVIVTDTEYRITYINKAAEDLFGYSFDDLIGKDPGILNAEPLAEEIQNGIYKTISSGEIWAGTALNKKKDGSTFFCEFKVCPIRDPKGNISHYVGVQRDITERIRFQEEQQRTAKLESIGTLAGGIAHDFNNLLTGIMGNIGLAKRYVEPKTKAEERLLEAEKASIRAKDLTQQLLTFARGGAPVKNTVSITGLLKESTGFALRGSNIRCDFNLPDDLWLVEVDEGQINQVVTNLVINAEEAMPEGGVININASNTVVQGRSTLPLNKGRYVTITIVDHGVGIKKEHLDRIFDPYFTTKQKGSGLGLATSYSIIKNHDGYIKVDSTLGVGTTFEIYLPASKKLVVEVEETKAKGVIAGEGRILVMDDEEIVQQFLHSGLTGIGYEVVLTKDGAEAIEQYVKAKESGQPFSAVIMDLTIPGGMGGKEAIKKLLEIDPDAMVIVSSGYSSDPIMSNFEEYGFSSVIAKPYIIEQLCETLSKLLGK
ncbi:PAS domain S-box protein [Chloroflexota bacterium]